MIKYYKCLDILEIYVINPSEAFANLQAKCMESLRKLEVQVPTPSMINTWENFKINIFNLSRQKFTNQVKKV